MNKGKKGNSDFKVSWYIRIDIVISLVQCSLT